MEKQLKTPLNWTFKQKSVEDYFTKYVDLVDVFAVQEVKLEPKEKRFLVLALLYSWEGNDLNNHTAFNKHLVDQRFCTTSQRASNYKQKLAGKRWCTTGRYKFELRKELQFTQGQDLRLSLGIMYKDEKT